MTVQPKPHLHQIKIQGFKSIKKLDLKLNPINILIGANGAGKTNFISLFTFLRHLSEGRLQSYVAKNGYASSFFHFGSKKTPAISLDLKVGANGYHVDFIHGETNDELVFEREYCTFEASSRLFYVKGKPGESGLLPDGTAESVYVRKYTREYLEKCRVYHFHDTSPTAKFKQAQKLSATFRFESDAGNLAPLLWQLKKSFTDSYQEILAAIQTIAPFFHDFYLEPAGQKGDESLLLRWLHKDHDTPFSANQLSDGTARFICMAVLFLQPEWLRPDTIVLDEPELGLHPAALDVLADIIKSVSQTTQVICSTQSVTFANHFSPEDFIVVDQHQGASCFKRLDAEELQHWLENYAMGDIWSKNLIGGRPEW
ncbi:AAA family ATPase [Marinospirillum alkaliphilum]|uniref:Predicted ATPase n=1 Tax=Marinospirillum alkaliphilum DSM 21637 TaxID=1122209 RepID=A0A1K1YXF4_9GAMM|nr:AAA family ATPase [Marinospirillum alkaliphilum]SFX65973.1 Predicted ATPase [Marinospirillum alkaliphilum DSM 21637]